MRDYEEEDEDIDDVETVSGVATCPCCGSVPNITHSIEQEGGSASISCDCGLTMEAWDEFNSHIAAKEAIRKWNKTAKSRKKVTVTKEEL